MDWRARVKTRTRVRIYLTETRQQTCDTDRMLNPLRRLGAVTLALSLIQLPAVPATDACAVHEDSRAHAGMAMPGTTQEDSDCGECARAGKESSCGESHPLGCAAGNACSAPAAEVTASAVAPRLEPSGSEHVAIEAPVSRFRPPETPPPRA